MILGKGQDGPQRETTPFYPRRRRDEKARCWAGT
jgi:GDP-D-mannose dehydratase